jgi:hypothetical protein
MNRLGAGIILLAVVMALGAAEAQAAPVTFNTTGVFSISGTNSENFTNGSGTTMLVFNGAPSVLVDTPAGASFGNLAVASTVPPMTQGPTVLGSFTLNFNQLAPPGMASLSATLSGDLGFDAGVATLAFTTTSVTIGGFTYTVNPLYVIALPVTGAGGAVPQGMTTIQGTVTGGAAVPDSGDTLVLLGGALLGLVFVQRRLQAA